MPVVVNLEKSEGAILTAMCNDKVKMTIVIHLLHDIQKKEVYTLRLSF